MITETLQVGSLGTNCYIVYNEGSDDAVVIDPGGDGDRILRALAGKTAAAVLLTHGHFDHTGGLHVFAGTPIYIHPADEIMLSDPAWSVGGMVGDTAPRPPATDYVMEGTHLQLAGLDIRVLHTPGHTPGSVVYLIGDTMFTGDTLFCQGFGRTDFPGGSEEVLIDSIRRRLFALPPETKVCPGHGPMTTIGEEKIGNPVCGDFRS